jgi:hypothetical protein
VTTPAPRIAGRVSFAASEVEPHGHVGQAFKPDNCPVRLESLTYSGARPHRQVNYAKASKLRTLGGRLPVMWPSLNKELSESAPPAN